MADPNLPHGGSVIVEYSPVLENAHRVGRALIALDNPELTEAIRAETTVELAAVEGSEPGNLTGRAQQAVLLSREGASPRLQPRSETDHRRLPARLARRPGTTAQPTALARYRAYVHNDLIPALGHIPLDDLAYEHIGQYARAELAAGRGKVTVHRVLATLSSALGAAVLRHRLGHNPAKPAIIPRPPTPERRIWTPDEAVRFLDYAHKHDPLFANLVELIINTGMRKGEALGLHWDDVHLDEGVLFVRYTLSTVDNHHTVLTPPKTPSSLSWIAINQRARRALDDLADHHFLGYTLPTHGYVFHHHGRPVNPKQVLDRFHRLCDETGVPRIAVHDLRHLATTLALNGGVPFVIVQDPAPPHPVDHREHLQPPSPARQHTKPSMPSPDSSTAQNSPSTPPNERTGHGI
ncbi:integrase [Kitasatospora sp. GP30]|uniref:tyrosine-type recombinase/integrase n=1 Tax=Kitasatospora sp. GP30 TaxID=3035084 RepID=UPI000CC99453|nr:site-specific integrase [Kitasatospora sp. GP30]MDH6145554.1 integrase [Kitasatospora sp. GP30]